MVRVNVTVLVLEPEFDTASFCLSSIHTASLANSARDRLSSGRSEPSPSPETIPRVFKSCASNA